jgi:hypothetical protein
VLKKWPNVLCGCAWFTGLLLLWLLCFLSRWISMMTSKLMPQHMTQQDHAVEFVSEAFALLYDLFFPHIVTCIFLVWMIWCIARRRTEQG